MNTHSFFQEQLKAELEHYLEDQQNQCPIEDLLRIDLHCHDYNSDEPDELLGRILKVPETWLSSEQLIDELIKNNCNAFTITNHNNARSCYELQKKGYDILTAAEFSCWVPDFSIGIHVLAFGFSPEQEQELGKFRKNVYAFQAYAHQQNIPTIWAHPLYHYSVKTMPPMDFFNKMLLIFERFEVLNGQRDTWQNILVKDWLEQIKPEQIDQYAAQFNIDPLEYCAHPYKKSFAGGSDSHMGLFAGLTGSLLYIPDLQKRMQTELPSTLALEALRNGALVPFGSHQNTEKLTIAFLDYTCQVALNYKDPGLIRLLLHKGDVRLKISSLIIGNLFCEVQKHKVTMSFVKLFHNCLMGHKPSALKKWALPSVYKPVFEDTCKIAKYYKKNKPNLVDKYYECIASIHHQMSHVLFSRLEKKIEKTDFSFLNQEKSVENLIEQLELPSNLRSYLTNETPNGNLNIAKFLDGLSFPFFASLFIASSHFASAKAMFHTRPFLEQFSEQINKHRHPKRLLWLTDTFDDKNGVSMFLREMHVEIKKRNLPIDILVCSDTLKSHDHLIVLDPVSQFTLPIYNEQKIKVPNLLQLHNLFLEGEYDRVISSTEGVMGACALYLKHAYSIKASFYLHTDWIMFARKVLNIQGGNLHRVQRIMRMFYQSFDQIFVLNSDQRDWLTSGKMNLKESQVFRTSHWTRSFFVPHPSAKEYCFNVEDNTPVLLYVGRLSEEKGVLEFPAIMRQVNAVFHNAKLVMVGDGPLLKQLKKELPQAQFISWVDQEKLPKIYASADLLLLPSWFDTFCNVVLESLGCGLPVIAYNSKGPKDIIEHDKNGFLVNQQSTMIERIIYYLSHPSLHASFKHASSERAKDYSADLIIDDFLSSIGLTE